VCNALIINGINSIGRGVYLKETSLKLRAAHCLHHLYTGVLYLKSHFNTEINPFLEQLFISSDTTMPAKDTKVFSPANPQEWREWLEENHLNESAVWLIYYKKSSQLTTITWSEAVDEALCFGWIDSTARPLDADRYMQFFTKRKPGGGWSKINKEKIRKLTEEGRMSQAGLDAIAAAKENGSWTLLDEVEELVVPDDLANALAENAVALSFFQKLSKSDKRHLLYWVSSAKRDDTRRKRIGEIVEFTGRNLKPKILTWTKKTS